MLFWLAIYFAIGMYIARRVGKKYDFEEDDFLLATLIVVLWGIPAMLKVIRYVSRLLAKVVLWKT
jgi:hypothetical protein